LKTRVNCTKTTQELRNKKIRHSAKLIQKVFRRQLAMIGAPQLLWNRVVSYLEVAALPLLCRWI